MVSDFTENQVLSNRCYSIKNIIKRLFDVLLHGFLFKNLDCDYLSSSDRNGYFKCRDRTFCDEDLCCINHGGRAKCPKDMPIMCANKVCADNTDHCCEITTESCNIHGGPRLCST